jgi:hypothetical protein
MRADRVEFSWDKDESSWLIRIVAGEEVIQRHFALPESSNEQALRQAVEKTVVARTVSLSTWWRAVSGNGSITKAEPKCPTEWNRSPSTRTPISR